MSTWVRVDNVGSGDYTVEKYMNEDNKMSKEELLELMKWQMYKWFPLTTYITKPYYTSTHCARGWMECDLCCIWAKRFYCCIVQCIINTYIL